MKATRKAICLLLATVVLLCALPVVTLATGESATEVSEIKEISFAKDRLLTVHEPLRQAPNSFHTVISLPVDAAGGVIFGNYLSDNYGFFSLEVNAEGNPLLKFTGKDGEVVTACFDGVDLRLGYGVALTVVRTDVAAYCYINGELKQRLSGDFSYGDVMTADDVWEPNDYGSLYADPNGQEFILGGDNTSGNLNYFKGSMSSLVLYTEALSATGVSEVIEGACDYAPLLSYAIGDGDSAYCVTDRSGNGHSASTTFYERPYELGEYEYSFAVVGDTQVQVEYDLKNGTTYTANIYDYIVNNKTAKKIGYVFGVGDITQTNTPEEWALAKEQITKLDAAGLGYSLVAGDHDDAGDYYDDHANMNDALLETVRPRIAGFYDEAYGLLNYYMTFEVGTEKYAVLCLEVGPRTPVIKWANEVIESHPDRKFIITTHSYLAKDGTTTDPGDSGAKNSAGSMKDGTPSNGDRLWDELASLHENVFMVFSGHIAYENVVMRQDRGVNGNTVTQFLVNPQSMAKSYSMICMLYFSADGTVRTEWISTTETKNAGADVLYKTQSTMTFDLGEFDEEGTLIAESRFDGGNNGISVGTNGTGTLYSTENGIYKYYYDKNNLPASSTQYASFIKRVNFDESYSYKYLTLEFDIATESEFFDEIQLFFVPRDASNTNKNGTRFYILGKNGTMYLSNNTSGSELYPLGISHANEWAHITVVFDTENMIGGDGDSYECAAHFFVNGKYAMTNEHPFQTGATYFNQMRLALASKYATAEGSICVDNLVMKGFKPSEARGIDEVLAEKWLSLSGVSGLDYKDGYVFPNGTPLARVTSGGTETLYYNEFDLGASVKEGDTVTMLRDAYTPVSFAYPVTVSDGGYKLVYDVGKAFSITTEGGVTTFCTANELVTVASGLTAAESAIIEQYADVIFTTSQTFSVNGYGSSVPKVWNMNGHSVTATAQSDHFLKFANSTKSLANWIINNGSISTNAKNTVYLANSNDYLEFNGVKFVGDASTVEVRDGRLRLTGCVYRAGAANFLTVKAGRINKGAYVYYRGCDITMLSTSPYGLTLAYNGSAGNDFKVTFEYCNIKRYTENSAKGLILTHGTADAALTEFCPTVNFIGSYVYSRIFAFHNFGELTVNVTEGSKLDIDHSSIDNCAEWTGSTYLGNATEPSADRYKLTMNIEDGVFLSIKNLVDNTAGTMNEENLVVNLGSSNSYPKATFNPNLPYIVGKPDFTVKSTLTLYSDFDCNLLIPVDAGVDRITVDGVVLTPVDVHTIGSEYYHVYTYENILVTEAADALNVALAGKEFELELNVSILAYAEKVLANAANAPAHQLMLDMLTYVKEAYLYAGKDANTVSEIEALITAYGVASTYAPTETETYIPDAIKEYVSSASLYLGNTPAFRFTVAKNATVTLSYVDMSGKLQSLTVSAIAGEFIELDMRLFDFASEITVTVRGVDVIGSYDLYTYISAVENDGDVTNDGCLALVKALYAYVMSARSYKEGL